MKGNNRRVINSVTIEFIPTMARSNARASKSVREGEKGDKGEGEKGEEEEEEEGVRERAREERDP